MTPDEIMAEDDRATMRQRLAEIDEEYRNFRGIRNREAYCAELNDEAREIWTDIRKLEGN